jgi:hypothetical protein
MKNESTLKAYRSTHSLSKTSCLGLPELLFRNVGSGVLVKRSLPASSILCVEPVREASAALGQVFFHHIIDGFRWWNGRSLLVFLVFR